MSKEISLNNGSSYMSAEDAMPAIDDRDLWETVVGCMDKAKKDPRGGARPGAGRKPRQDAGKKQQHSIGLFPAEWHALGEMGAAQGLSATQYAAEALRRHIAELSR